MGKCLEISLLLHPSSAVFPLLQHFMLYKHKPYLEIYLELVMHQYETVLVSFNVSFTQYQLLLTKSNA